MKSLAERLKEKEARLAKEKLKRSGPVKCFSVRIPHYGHPHINTEGDLIYIKQRAKAVIDKIRSSAVWQFYEALKEVIEEATKHEKENAKVFESRWGTFTITPPETPSPATTDNGVVAPVAPATPPPANNETNNEHSLVTSIISTTLPGVLVTEGERTNPVEVTSEQLPHIVEEVLSTVGPPIEEEAEEPLVNQGFTRHTHRIRGRLQRPSGRVARRNR